MSTHYSRLTILNELHPKGLLQQPNQNLFFTDFRLLDNYNKMKINKQSVIKGNKTATVSQKPALDPLT